MKDVTIADLFAKDGDRFLSSPQPSTIRCWWITPQNRITEETLAKLQDLAKEARSGGRD
ncbi:hypothetical protein ACLK1Z_23130 [Escherichia coli]